MKRDCPDCRRLRAEARQPGADLADILVDVILHEQKEHPQRPRQAAQTAPYGARR